MNSAGDRPLDSAGILLDMRNVAVDAPCPETRQDNRIVDNVSLVLRRGEVLGIIGESGAGKSTVGLASLAYGRGGTRISAGEVWFKGVDLRTLSAQQLRIIRGSKVAYVSQSAAAAFNPAHRLIDQVIETAVVKGILSRNDARQRALALFAALKLPHPEELALRYPHQLSGGQLQRVMTAMALCPKPDLIVFDEPTTALDVTTQIEVLVAIKETIRAEKTAALYISHDLALVAQIADRILVLRHGKFVETGATRQILEDPQQSYTSRLVKVSLTKARSDLPLPEESVTLSVRRVTAAYGLGRNVLSDVSLAVARGRTLAIVGESGSGKSSLARTIAGLLAPSRGEMEFLARPLAPLWRDRTREQLRQIQLVYQCPDTALNPRQTVADIIGRPLSFYHGARGAARRRRSIELLGLVEMGEHFLSRRPADLSGGQKQRVCIARALAAEPKLLICDEITAALDPLVAEEVLKMMLRLQQQTQLSFVFITHDISIVRAIADSVAVMHNGNIVRYGTNLECFSPPYDAYTELLLESVPEMRPGWLNELLTGRNQLSSKIAGGTNAVSVGMAPS